MGEQTVFRVLVFVIVSWLYFLAGLANCELVEYPRMTVVEHRSPLFQPLTLPPVGWVFEACLRQIKNPRPGNRGC